MDAMGEGLPAHTVFSGDSLVKLSAQLSSPRQSLPLQVMLDKVAERRRMQRHFLFPWIVKKDNCFYEVVIGCLRGKSIVGNL